MEDLKNILARHGFSFKKKFGQNFLTDTNLLSAIVHDAGVDETVTVLEIGAWAGAAPAATAPPRAGLPASLAAPQRDHRILRPLQKGLQPGGHVRPAVRNQQFHVVSSRGQVPLAAIGTGIG